MKCSFCNVEGPVKFHGTSKYGLCPRCYNSFSRYYNTKRRGGNVEDMLVQFSGVVVKLHKSVVPMAVPKYLRDDLLEYNSNFIVEKEQKTINLFGDII